MAKNAKNATTVSKPKTEKTPKPITAVAGHMGMMDATAFIGMAASIIASGALANDAASGISDEECEGLENQAIRSATRIWNKAHAVKTAE